MYAVRAGLSCVPLIGPVIGFVNASHNLLSISCLLYMRNDLEVDQQLRMLLQQGRFHAACGMIGCITTINKVTDVTTATIHDQLAIYGMLILSGAHCYTLHIYNKIEQSLGREVDNLV